MSARLAAIAGNYRVPTGYYRGQRPDPTPEGTPMTSEDDVTAAGSSTDQHVTGTPETGEFLTDQAPTAGTPAHGSSNVGINDVGANRPDAMEPDAMEPDAMEEATGEGEASPG